MMKEKTNETIRFGRVGIRIKEQSFASTLVAGSRELVGAGSRAQPPGAGSRLSGQFPDSGLCLFFVFWKNSVSEKSFASTLVAGSREWVGAGSRAQPPGAGSRLSG